MNDTPTYKCNATLNDYYIFRRNYFRGNYPQLRLGQAFVNAFVDGTWPELFYESDPIKTEKMIINELT